MFCPACGRNNGNERKFCASCGINLEAVTQALTRGSDDFLTKIDAGIDQFMGKYSERVFKNATPSPLDHSVGKSWKILGRGVATSFIDLFLFLLMWNLIPLRFLMLLLTTPVRLLSERGKVHKGATSELEESRARPLPEARETHEWIPGTVASVTEHTTVILADTNKTKLETAPPEERRQR